MVCLAVVGETEKIRMADKCGEVEGLRVERAVGIQIRPPSIQPVAPKFTYWRFGNLEKSKDRSKALRPPTFGGGVLSILNQTDEEKGRDLQLLGTVKNRYVRVVPHASTSLTLEGKN